MKTLMVYYSLEGNTKYMAQLIAKHMKADLLELKPVKEYPKGSISKFIWGGKAATLGEKPKLQPYQCDVSAYDLIILGTPLWNKRITPPLNTFLQEQDIKNKKVAVVISCAGGNCELLVQSLKAKLSHVVGVLNVVNPLKQKEEAKKKAEQFVKELTQGEGKY